MSHERLRHGLCVAIVLTIHAQLCPQSRASHVDNEPGRGVEISVKQDAPKGSLSPALAHYTLGVIHDNEGSIKDAVKEYREAMRLDKDNSLIRVRLGAAYLVLGENERAIEQLEYAKKIAPEDPAAYFILAIVYTSQGDYEGAQEEYESIITLNPGNIKALVFLADLYMIQEKLEDAAGVYERIRDTETASPLLHFNLGIIYTKLNRIDEAITEIQRATELAPEYVEAYLALGLLYEMNESYALAEGAYEQALERVPDNPKMRQHIARVAYLAGNKEKAVETYRAIIEKFDGYSEGYISLALIFIKEKEYENALTVLQQAEKNELVSIRLYTLLGYAATLAGDIEQGLMYYDKGLAMDDSHAMLLFYRGMAFDRSGKRDVAIADFRKAIDADPGMHEAYNYLGYLYAEEGIKLDEAERLIREALELKPESGAYIDSLGWVYYKKGEYKKALKLLERAIDREGDDPVIREHIGDVYHKLDMDEKAREAWERSLALDTTQEKVREKIKELK